MQRMVVQSFFTTSRRQWYNVSRYVACTNIQSMKYSQDNSLPKWITSSNGEREPETVFSNFDADEFGTLSGVPPHINEELEKMPEEADDVEEFEMIGETGKKTRRRPEFYHVLIKKLLSQKKLSDALHVLETRLLKKEKQQGDYYVWNLMITGCARAGYCQKAFSLYKQMKDRGMRRTPATYTSLFNACAESPFPDDALIRLNHLRKNLQEEGVELNVISYNAMIKGYARLKDVHSAFLVVDEMLTKKFTLLPETFNFLFQACISDKENGLRHALLTWHKMRAKKVTPNLYTYNLLIRCINECEFGDEDDVKEVIHRIIRGTARSQVLIEEEKSDIEVLLIEEDKNTVKTIVDNSSDQSDDTEFSMKELDMMENRPNLLAKKPHLGTIISVRNCKNPADKLLLLGGYKTLIEEMKNDGVQPDIRTYTQLLNIMPSSKDSERYLLEEIEKHNVEMDIGFCNMLIKQRAYRNDYEGAKEVLKLIQKKYLHPDIVTFGVLALSCGNQYQAEELIQNMREFSYRLNIEIIGAMLGKAAYGFKFGYAEYLMRLLQKMKIKPCESFMKRLDELDRKATEFRKRVKKKDDTVPSFVKKQKFHEESVMFKKFLDQWKKEVEVFIPPHPYEQFKTPPGDISHEINNEDIQRFGKREKPWTRDQLVPKYPPGHEKFKFENKSSKEVLVTDTNDYKDGQIFSQRNRYERKEDFKSNVEYDEDDEKIPKMNWKRNPNENRSNDHDDNSNKLTRKKWNKYRDDENPRKSKINWIKNSQSENRNCNDKTNRTSRKNYYEGIEVKSGLDNAIKNTKWKSLNRKKSDYGDSESNSNDGNEFRKLNWKKKVEKETLQNENEESTN